MTKDTTKLTELEVIIPKDKFNDMAFIFRKLMETSLDVLQAIAQNSDKVVPVPPRLEQAQALISGYELDILYYPLFSVWPKFPGPFEWISPPPMFMGGVGARPLDLE